MRLISGNYEPDDKSDESDDEVFEGGLQDKDVENLSQLSAGSSGEESGVDQQGFGMQDPVSNESKLYKRNTVIAQDADFEVIGRQISFKKTNFYGLTAPHFRNPHQTRMAPRLTHM